MHRGACAEGALASPAEAIFCPPSINNGFLSQRDMNDNNGIGGEVRHGVTLGVSCETALNKHVNTSPPQAAGL